MLTWAEGVLYGAGGGLIVEAVTTYGRLHAWQQARHAAREAAAPRPSIGRFIDPPADSLSALYRVVLGGVAGWLLHGEVSGVFAAVAVGASAPALLAQVGRSATSAQAVQVSPVADSEAGTVAGASAQPAVPGSDPVQGEVS